MHRGTKALKIELVLQNSIFFLKLICNLHDHWLMKRTLDPVCKCTQKADAAAVNSTHQGSCKKPSTLTVTNIPDALQNRASCKIS